MLNLTQQKMKLGKSIQKIIKNRVFQNSVAMTIVQITQYIIPFLMLALLTRRLGPDAYSLLAFVFAIVQISNIVTDYGFYLSATEKLSKKRTSENVINYILGSVIIQRYGWVGRVFGHYKRGFY